MRNAEKRIVEGLRAIRHHVEWPGGAFYAFPNISAHLSIRAGKPALAKSCTKYQMLLEKVQVAVVPGEASAHPLFALSYATSIED